MPAGQDLIVAIITLGALMIIIRNIAKGRRSACGRGGCGCAPGPESTAQHGEPNRSNPADLGDRMGQRRELVQLRIDRSPSEAASHPENA